MAHVLAKVIDALVAHGMRLQDLTIVGHSLGCHISGRAAKQLKSEGKIAVIIALDPASVLFDYFETDKRLSETDAEYVQVIHTDGGHYSFEFPLGHADFYPNGGKNQPGCKAKNAFASLVGTSHRADDNEWLIQSVITTLFCLFPQINVHMCVHMPCTWKAYQPTSPAFSAQPSKRYRGTNAPEAVLLAKWAETLATTQ